MENNNLICPKCGQIGRCYHQDNSSAEIYMTTFFYNCSNLDCGYQDKSDTCCGHAGEFWESATCPYCGCT